MLHPCDRRSPPLFNASLRPASHLQLMRYESDDNAVCIDTGIKPVKVKWNMNGTVSGVLHNSPCSVIARSMALSLGSLGASLCGPSRLTRCAVPTTRLHTDLGGGGLPDEQRGGGRARAVDGAVLQPQR